MGGMPNVDDDGVPSGATATVTAGMGGTGTTEKEMTGPAPEEGKFPGATGLRYIPRRLCQELDPDEVGLLEVQECVYRDD